MGSMWRVSAGYSSGVLPTCSSIVARSKHQKGENTVADDTIEVGDAEGSDAKAIQDVDSSGTVGPRATLSPGEAVLSGVRDGVAKTDEPEIAGDYDVDHHESTSLGWSKAN